MEFSQILSCGLLIILVCWLSVNNAIPLGSDSELEVIQTTTFQPNTESSETVPITVQPIVTSAATSDNGRAYRSIDSKNHSAHINQHDVTKNDEVPTQSHQVFQNDINQHDLMKNNGVLTQSHQVHQKGRQSQPEVSITDNKDSNIHIGNADTSSKSDHKHFEDMKSPLNKIQSKDKCMNEERRQNQTYTRSILLNTSSINPEEDFKISGEPEAKKTSSVHIGEDIALCWIETITIKEDNLFDPPKRLVIREFSISFENSASIPDSYLECNDIEGEIAPGDENTIRKTALHEVIDENSKRSREVNFTHVSTEGRIIVHHHKKVKCGVGVAVSKDIFEWPDGTDNPKKRIEIKVGPSIRDLRSTSDNEGEGCTTKPISRNTQIEQNHTSSSTPSDEILALCEDGDCSKTDTSCEGDCSRKNLSEETTYPSSDNELMSTGVTEATTTTREPNGTKSSMPLRHNSHRHRDEPCSESDTNCKSLQSTTIEPQRINKTFENCSGEDCLEGSSEESNSELSCDQSSDSSCSCSGDNCETKQNSTGSNEDSDQIIIQDGESCKNGSESCICNGSSCYTKNSEEIKSLESGDKRTDDLLNQTTTKPFANSTYGISPSQMSSETNVPPRFNSEQDKNGNGTVEPTLFDKHSNPEASTEQIETTKIPEVTRSTNFPGEIGDTPGTGNVSSCSRSGLGNCSKVTPNITIHSNAISKESEEHFVSLEVNSSREIRKEEVQSLNSSSNGIESSSTCSEGDESCTTVQPNKKIALSANFTNKMTDTSSASSRTETITPISEQFIPFTTISFNDAETEISTTRVYEEIDELNKEMIGLVLKNSTNRKINTKKSNSDSIATGTALHEILSSEKLSATNCSTDSEKSSDCVHQTATHSPNFADVSTSPSVLGTSALPKKSCDTSENCGSMDSSSRSDETNDLTAGKTRGQVETASICEDGDESCEDSSSSSKSTEICEDGSTNCRSGSSGSISTSCDSASNSCSSETNESGMNTTIQLAPKELEFFSTVNDTVSSIAETRRSVIPTTPLSTPAKGRHRLALKIKVLLEHIDENKEKEKLVEVEKNLLLNENFSERGNNSLMWQLQALNNTMNLETLKAIFNCSGLKSLSIDKIDVDELSKNPINYEINNLKKVNQKAEEKLYLTNTTEVPLMENSESSTAKDDNEYAFHNNTNKKLRNRKKREISSPLDETTEVENYTISTTEVFEENVTDSTTVVFEENVTDSTTVVFEENVTDSTTVVSVENFTDSTTRKEILQSLSGVEEDLTNGMNHVLSLISKRIGDSTSTDRNTTSSVSSSKILKILSNPSDSRVHFKNPEIIPRIKRSVTVEQLTTPVHGEEIERWSKERFVGAADGGRIRRLTEFRILRDNKEDS